MEGLDLDMPQDFLDFLADLSGMEDGSIELPSRVPEGMIGLQMPPDFESLMEDVLPPVAGTSFPASTAPTGSLDLPQQFPSQASAQGEPSLAWSQPQAAVPQGVASVVERQPTASASSGEHRHASSHSSGHEAPGGPQYGLAPFAGVAQLLTEQPRLTTESQTARQWSGSRVGSDSEEEFLALNKMDRQARNRIAQRKCRARKRNKQAEVQAEMQRMRSEIARLQGQNELLQQQAARVGKENIELLQENQQLRLGIAREQRQPVGIDAIAAAAAAAPAAAPHNAAEGPAAVDGGCENGIAGAEHKGPGTPSGFPTAMHSISPAMQAKLDAVLPPNTVVKMALCDDAGERISLSVEAIKSSTPPGMREMQLRYLKEMAKQLQIATTPGNPSAAAEAAQRVTALVMEAMLLYFCSAMYNARTYQIVKVSERIDPRHGPDFRGPLTFKEPNEQEIERMKAHMDALLNVTDRQRQLLLQARHDLYVKLLRLEADRADYIKQLEQACVSDMRGAKHLAMQYLQQMDLLDLLGTSFRDQHEAICDFSMYINMKVFTPLQCALVAWMWYPRIVDFLGYLAYLARKSGEPPLAGADGKLTRRLNRSVEAALSAQVQALRPFSQPNGMGPWSQQAPIITINPRSTRSN